MKLQVWAEVDIPYPGEDPNEWVTALQDGYPSLSGLAADFIEQPDAKVIVSLEGRRVVLQMHPKIVCPECRRVIEKAESGRFLFQCRCGHAEGDTMRELFYGAEGDTTTRT